jgi:peroxiredoxin
MRTFLVSLLCAVLPLAAQGLSGRRAPSFSLPDSTMRQHDVLDFRGRWLLLDFMKTDCPHCKSLSKTLEELKARYGAKVAVLSVVISPPENTATVGKYITENKVTTPIVFDQGQVAIAYFRATPANPSFDTPHLFVIDPNGQILRDWGHSDQSHDILEGKGLARELDQLMAGKK